MPGKRDNVVNGKWKAARYNGKTNENAKSAIPSALSELKGEKEREGGENTRLLRNKADGNAWLIMIVCHK